MNTSKPNSFQGETKSNNWLSMICNHGILLASPDENPGMLRNHFKIAWRNRAFYAGGEEAELASGADLAHVQAAANAADFAEKLA